MHGMYGHGTQYLNPQICGNDPIITDVFLHFFFFCINMFTESFKKILETSLYY